MRARPAVPWGTAFNKSSTHDRATPESRNGRGFHKDRAPLSDSCLEFTAVVEVLLPFRDHLQLAPVRFGDPIGMASGVDTWRPNGCPGPCLWVATLGVYRPAALVSTSCARYAAFSVMVLNVRVRSCARAPMCAPHHLEGVSGSTKTKAWSARRIRA